MKRRATQADQAAKRNNTRSLTERLRDYCEDRGFQMPEEFLLDVMNGEDPRGTVSAVDDYDHTVSTSDRIAAARILMPYIYAKKTDVKLSGDLSIFPVPEIKATQKQANKILDKVKKIL